MTPTDHKHQRISLREVVDLHWEAHQREHESDNRAIVLAREDVNRRLEGMNELRNQITDERGDYMTRKEYDAKHDTLIERVSALERSRSNLEGKLWALGAVVVVIQLALAALPHLVKTV